MIDYVAEAKKALDEGKAQRAIALAMIAQADHLQAIREELVRLTERIEGPVPPNYEPRYSSYQSNEVCDVQNGR